MYVDTQQLAAGRKLLVIYTSRGNRLSAVGKTKAIRVKAGWGVHVANLFASHDLALAAYAHFFKRMTEEAARAHL
jgi:hypothetical protein